VLWCGGFQAGNRRLRCTDPGGYLRLRKARFGSRFEHLIEKSEFLGKIIVRLLNFRARKRARLELL